MKLKKSPAGLFLTILYYLLAGAVAFCLMMLIMMTAGVVAGFVAALALGIAVGVIGGKLEFSVHKNILHKKSYKGKKTEETCRVIEGFRGII
jgi:hypothetical protein